MEPDRSNTALSGIRHPQNAFLHGAPVRSGQVAQSVEQGIENPRVGGSIPSLATIKNPVNPETYARTYAARR